MSVSSRRSRVADLAFQVFGRVIQPDWFAVRGFRRINQGNWQADIRLVDGGHAVHWQSGDIRLVEVLCGPETILPEPGLLFHSSVRHERTATLRRGDRAEYQTCFDVERIDPELFRRLSEEIEVDSREGLFHRYSAPSRLSLSPLSHVCIEARPRGLSIQAFHTFPDERSIVRTQSLFELLPTPTHPA